MEQFRSGRHRRRCDAFDAGTWGRSRRRSKSPGNIGWCGPSWPWPSGSRRSFAVIPDARRSASVGCWTCRCKDRCCSCCCSRCIGGSWTDPEVNFAIPGRGFMAELTVESYLNCYQFKLNEFGIFDLFRGFFKDFKDFYGIFRDSWKISRIFDQF